MASPQSFDLPWGWALRWMREATADAEWSLARATTPAERDAAIRRHRDILLMAVGSQRPRGRPRGGA